VGSRRSSVSCVLLLPFVASLPRPRSLTLCSLFLFLLHHRGYAHRACSSRSCCTRGPQQGIDGKASRCDGEFELSPASFLIFRRHRLLFRSKTLNFFPLLFFRSPFMMLDSGRSRRRELFSKGRGGRGMLLETLRYRCTPSPSSSYLPSSKILGQLHVREWTVGGKTSTVSPDPRSFCDGLTSLSEHDPEAFRLRFR